MITGYWQPTYNYALFGARSLVTLQIFFFIIPGSIILWPLLSYQDMKDLAIYRYLQSQNNWKPCFDFISLHGCGWNPRTTVRWEPTPPPPTTLQEEFWWSDRTISNYWVQMKRSSVLTLLPHGSVASLWFRHSCVGHTHHLHLQHLTS